MASLHNSTVRGDSRGIRDCRATLWGQICAVKVTLGSAESPNASTCSTWSTPWSRVRAIWRWSQTSFANEPPDGYSCPQPPWSSLASRSGLAALQWPPNIASMRSCNNSKCCFQDPRFRPHTQEAKCIFWFDFRAIDYHTLSVLNIVAVSRLGLPLRSLILLPFPIIWLCASLPTQFSNNDRFWLLRVRPHKWSGKSKRAVLTRWNILPTPPPPFYFSSI